MIQRGETKEAKTMKKEDAMMKEAETKVKTKKEEADMKWRPKKGF